MKPSLQRSLFQDLRLRAGLLAALFLLGVAGAQYAYSKLTLGGRDAQAIVLGGAEYASQLTVEGLSAVKVSREDPYVRVSGLGHELILPIDQDSERAATDFNTVQLDSTRLKARTATLVNGEVYLPLDTLARGLGADYRTGDFSLPAAALTNVSSRAGKDTDRIVLDFSRDLQYAANFSGNILTLTLKGVNANPRTYATRGAFVPQFEVKTAQGNASIAIPLGNGAGYRLFKVIRPGSVRLVLDVGPGLPRNIAALADVPRSPLIVLDPAPKGGGSVDIPLEVARATGELLSKAGWQVQLTRSSAGRLPVAQREKLARQSQVFVTLSVGRFPGSGRKGITLYQPVGDQNAQIINAFRSGAGGSDLVRAAVGDGGETKRLAELLMGELGSRGLKAGAEQIPRLFLPGEAPHASFELELGWPQNAGDLANLITAQRTVKVSEALALSVATFLKARATNLTGSGQ
ncbi:N-acetylmuramoyl-L-alanine amidase [Deinococcus psychrotolerans]|uniref:N-acetylmuramoyl-L-alanine amidase n=1 Tax=Deinococcus psychrotolerans TaxID=2489213 RepID=A0A3G8YJX2_9DEIO|nr:N-acetylmuramoyl-L-alanine amidase [Deinococcus psychrotolerans]AZI41781.1 N-acetylmuramoyl-L-alanine amidase [Deinococcus psychrotolerans]